MVFGHLWTIVPNLKHRVLPRRPPRDEPWTTALEDPRVGRVTLTGRLREREDSDALCVVVHGLGGAIDSQYIIRAAHAVDEAGLSCLRLALRGADRSGEDFYHAGLTVDLAAAIASPALARYRRLYLLGYSLGGHVSLSLGVTQDLPDPAPTLDPRVRAIASVCAPLDLHASGASIDAPTRAPYRAHLLSGLREIYEQVAARRSVPTPLSVIRKVRSIRDWDRHAVVPRFGFADVNDYYDRVSVGRRLHSARVPCLIVHTNGDPMVPAHTVRPSLHDRPDHVEARWVRGGHVGYPGRLDLGFGARPGLERQIMTWLQRHR